MSTHLYLCQVCNELIFLMPSVLAVINVQVTAELPYKAILFVL